MDILVLIVIIVLPIIAQINVSATFNKYAKVHNTRGLTADQVARRILDANGLYNVGIERVGGKLTDHYDPTSNVVRLSESTFGQTSVAAIGVAAHECGHACQHAENYAPIVIRSKLVPVTNICSRLWYFVFLIGIFVFQIFPALVYIGIAMFGAVVLFQAVTLPAELDASHRALKTLENDMILEQSEVPQARKVLTAAAMTYVTALVTSLIQLLTLLSSFNRR